MPDKPRRFTLVDGIIIIAAAALALAAMRWGFQASEMENFFRILTINSEALDAGSILGATIWLATPPLVVSTLAVLAMRLRQPRPRWRRLVRQPGFVACLALLLIWAIALPLIAATTLTIEPMIVRTPGSTVPGPDMRFDPANWLLAFEVVALLFGGSAVVVAWTTQAIVGRWRPERSWVDRLGRVVAAGWVAIGLVDWYQCLRFIEIDLF